MIEEKIIILQKLAYRNSIINNVYKKIIFNFKNKLFIILFSNAYCTEKKKIKPN